MKRHVANEKESHKNNNHNKTMIKKILLMVLMLAPITVFAQKFAHYDSQEIAKVYPAYLTAQTELEALGKQYENDLQEMQKELQTKFEKYQNEVNESTPANMRQRREQELNDLQQRIQQAYQDNQKNFQEEQAKKMQPIIQKLQDAVNAVLKEGGYVYAIDKSTAASVVINESISTDITAQIKTKLGIQ